MEWNSTVVLEELGGEIHEFKNIGSLEGVELLILLDVWVSQFVSRSIG